MWWVLVTALVPHIRAPPGVYKCASLDLSVCVYNADFACVRWADECATVVHDQDRGLVIGEPLGSRMRQAGLILADVDYDGGHLDIRLDGRHKVTLALKLSGKRGRESDAPPPSWRPGQE